MMKSMVSALTRLCVKPQYHNAASLGVFQQSQQLHLTGSHWVLDKDHPNKKATDKLRSEQDQSLNTEDETDLMELSKLESIFPSIETHAMLINGVRYDQLPVIHVKATHNNTIITATDGNGKPVANASGGTVGFRNARKGTNIAAQAAAISLAGKAIKNGIDIARVSVKGIGPGRLPAIKGLQMSGITIVSVTDATPLPHNGHRPKKQRRL